MTRLNRKQFLQVAAAAVGGAALPALHAASGYPARPVRLVVPFSAGGTTDVVARIVAQAWERELGAPIIIDNKPGAGGNIGADQVAKAPKDGYTLLYGTISNYALNVGLYKKLPYAPLTDLAPIGMVVQVPIVLVVSTKLGVKNFDEFAKLLRANPGKFNYGSAGNGTSAHIACHLLLQKIGAAAEHIPYKGNNNAMNDTVAGNLAFTVSSVPAAEELIKAGQLIPIAAISSRRLEAFPNLPTTAELGVKDYDAYAWHAVTAPAGIEQAVLEKLHASLRATLANPALNAKLQKQGVVPLPNFTVEQTRAYLKSEMDKWVPIVRSSAARVD